MSCHKQFKIWSRPEYSTATRRREVEITLFYLKSHESPEVSHRTWKINNKQRNKKIKLNLLNKVAICIPTVSNADVVCYIVHLVNNTEFTGTEAIKMPFDSCRPKAKLILDGVQIPHDKVLPGIRSGWVKGGWIQLQRCIWGLFLLTFNYKIIPY